MGHCLMMRKGEVHTAPVTGVLASSLAVGSTVKLMEGGTAVEYLVVNQGIPSNSSLYDASCDGTWLLRKDCHSQRKWDSSGNNTYNSSGINTWLNGTFFNSLGSIEQAAIQQVKIPYCVGNGDSTVNSGANGLSTKAFLLSGYELGWTRSTHQSFPVDGAALTYFQGTSAIDGKRIAKVGTVAVYWWIRSPSASSKIYVLKVYRDGDFGGENPDVNAYVRPALILPSNALFDKTTMLLKGVK